MKKVNKFDIPQKLEIYFANNPTKTWIDFKKSKNRYEDIIYKLKKDQGGVCCYCENNFHQELTIIGDFRVEHFHPKSDTSNSNKNWNLIWSNLLGCCTGGNQNIKNPDFLKERYIPNHQDRHCDVLKDNNNWDNEILNPLELPSFPPIFKVSNNGEMIVLEDNCKATNINIPKAKNCLDETKLNLNSPILKSWRKSVIDNLRNEMIETADIEFFMENIEDLLSTYLLKDTNGNYSPFFTTIRSYFEEDAEEFLRLNNYDG
jgi:uncharacterized protein (TIGR02646 family)